MNSEVKTNSAYAWFLAARPKTLTGAAIPVLIGSALALTDEGFQWIPALACLFFAFLMQIAANFINDLFDFLKGSDREDRLGPERACAQGWITPSAMKIGIAVTLILAGMVGCITLWYGGKVLIAIGLSSMLFAFLYTTVLSYEGMGDLLVIVFFGLTAVGGTYYLLTNQWTLHTTLLALSCGFVIETLLVVNNYRDRDADARSHKRTLIVQFGEPFGRYLYLFSGLIAAILPLFLLPDKMYFTAFMPLIYILPHYRTWERMVTIRSGKRLNEILGSTSRNMMIYGLLTTIALIIDHLMGYQPSVL